MPIEAIAHILPPRSMAAPLAWIEVAVLVPRGWHELVAEVLLAHSRTGIALGPASLASEEPPEGFDVVRTFLAESEDEAGRRRAIAEDLASLATRTGASELALIVPRFRALPHEDWASSWKMSWKPFRIGKLCVLPPGREWTLRPGELRLTLEPGAAFGTGRHSTTRACLAALQERLTAGERVLDAGTGSGILAVTACLLGAERALGFDIDPHAIPTARHLARENAVAHACEFRAGGFEVLTAQDGLFDAVLANIYADVLITHVGELHGRLRPGGWFAFSGISAPNARAVEDALRRHGLILEERRVRGRWHTIIGRRSG